MVILWPTPMGLTEKAGRCRTSAEAGSTGGLEHVRKWDVMADEVRGWYRLLRNCLKPINPYNLESFYRPISTLARQVL